MCVYILKDTLCSCEAYGMRPTNLVLSTVRKNTCCAGPSLCVTSNALFSRPAHLFCDTVSSLNVLVLSRARYEWNDSRWREVAITAFDVSDTAVPGLPAVRSVQRCLVTLTACVFSRCRSFV